MIAGSTVHNTLHLALDKPFPEGLSAYTFTVDEQMFDIKFSRDGTGHKYWSIPGPPWSDGQVIKLSLINNTKVVPTVEFSPPNPSVNEGETAIMRYTLPNVTAGGGLTLQFKITESPPTTGQYMVHYSNIRDSPGGAKGTFSIYVAPDYIPEHEQRLAYQVWFLKGGLVVSEGSGVVTIPVNDHIAFDGKYRIGLSARTTSGCSDTNTAIENRCTRAVINNVVTLSGATYRITELYASNSDELRITVSDNFDINNLVNYTLRLPSSSVTNHFHFRDANLTGSTAIWSVNGYHQFILPAASEGGPGHPVQIILTSFLNPQGQLVAAAASADTEEDRIALSHEQPGPLQDGPPPYYQGAPPEETTEQETPPAEDAPEQESTTETPEQETSSSSEDTPEQETPPAEDAPESIVAQYDTDGSGVIEQDEWSRAVEDYASGKLTNEEIYAISAARA